MKGSSFALTSYVVPLDIGAQLTRATTWRDWAWSAGVTIGVAAIAVVAHWMFFKLVCRIVQRKRSVFWDLLVRYELKPTRLALPLMAMLAVFPWLPIPPTIASWLIHGAGLVLIATVAWGSLAALDVLK